VETRVCFPFVGDSVGGSHVSSRHLLAGLPAEGFAPLIVLHQDGPLAEQLAGWGLSWQEAPTPAARREASGPAYLAAAVRSAPRLARWLRTQRIAVVHTNDVRMHLAWGLAARLALVPHVRHQRTVFDGGRTMRALLRLSVRIVAISQTVADSLPPRFRSRVRIVPNPIAEPADADRITARRALREELGLPVGATVVGLVGNLGTQKRPEVLLDAAALLVADGQPWRFVLVGDGRGRELALRERVKGLGLEKQVHLLPPRYPIEPLLAALDLLAAPAVGEGHGRVLVEAMLAGTPVVAARSGGHIEVLGAGGGLLVPPDDAAALATGLAQLAVDPDAARNARAAGGRLRQFHAVGDHVRAVADMYRELLALPVR